MTDKGLTVLIIDDDEVDRMMVSRALASSKADIDFCEAGSAREGIRAARERPFDCIFLDYLLPDGDGLSVLVSLRAAGVDGPIVVLTGHGDECLAVEVMKAGASDYLPKGAITPDMLWRTIQHVARVYHADLERKRAEQEQKILIAKLKEAQHQLLQSEKMASIGQLAAGVAHEINNPVGYVHSNIGTLRQYVADLFKVIEAYEQAESKLADSGVLDGIHALKKQIDLDYLKGDLNALLDESQDGVRRVKQIVQDLKDFSHVNEAECQWADLHQGLNSTLNIVQNEIKYKADVVKEYGELPQVECNASQLNQVFMNLLVNAAHAIEERGVITIRTGTEGEGWVWVEIGDTGKGIAPEHLKRIFEPFFTTKPVGKGTGLGLSLSCGIVDKHGGRIEARSELGHGAAFRVWLPVERATESEAG